MRIAEIVPSLAVGGAERMAVLLSQELVQRGHEVQLISLYDPVGSFLEGELPVVHLGKSPGLDLRIPFRLRRALREFRPDVVHTHLHALHYALAAGVGPIVHTLHNVAEREAEPAARALYRLAFRAGVVAPIAIGDACAESIRAIYGIEPAATIPNGIRLPTPPPASTRERIRAELGIHSDAAVIVTAGRLNAQKDHATLLRALPEGTELWIAGEGELLEELRGLAGPQVRFIGVRSDLPDVFAAADVFALSSRYEGNPLVVMEAMASGLPVVATAVGCVPELVGETGRLVAPGDADTLRDGLVAALRDGRDVGRAGAEIARSRFDASEMARRYEEVFEERIRRRKGRMGVW